MLTTEQRKAIEWAILVFEDRGSKVASDFAETLRGMLAASAAPAEGRETEENVSLIAKMSAKLYTCHVATVSVAIDDFRDLLAYVHDLRCRIATAPTTSEAEQDVLWRHKKTGGVYSFVAESRMERDPKAVVVTYRNINTGETWTRPYGEFYDGRFERIDRAAAKGESDEN